jgi:hypothetical protein
MLLEVVSNPRIAPEGKAQADSKAQQPRQHVSISRGLQSRHQGSDGVMKPLLWSFLSGGFRSGRRRQSQAPAKFGLVQQADVKPAIRENVGRGPGDALL